MPDPLEREANPDYLDEFKFAILGTGYPLPGGYDDLPAPLCITGAWKLAQLS